MNNSSNRNRTHIFVALFSFLIFLIPATYKIVFLKYPVLYKPVENLWTVELKIQFQGTGKKAAIYHYLPKSDKGQSILKEDFVSQDFSFTIEKKGPNIGINWKGKNPKGDIQLFYRATVETKPRSYELTSDTVEKKYSPSIFQYLILDQNLESINVELDDFLKNLTYGLETKQEKLIRIYQFLINDVATVQITKSTNLIDPIKKKKATLSQKQHLFINLARMVEIPARSVHGIFLEEGEKIKTIHSWAEVYLQGKWIPVDIENKWFAYLPENLLILYNGDEPFMAASVKPIEYRYTASKEKEYTFSQFYNTSAKIGSKFHEWSLFGLSLETQQVFRLILLIPLGALVVSIFRNIIGLVTFGTFMPVLIALAFRSTKLWWGVLLFTLVVALGLGSRWAMDRLKLLVVQRLSVIATFLVILLAFGTIIGQKCGVYRIMAAALFPMIIMTMTIERLSIILMEKGKTQAILISFQTLVVTLCCYAVMANVSIQDFLFAFPEVLFAFISVQILLGRYTGYRLTEYFRFINFIRSNGKS